MKHVQFKVNTIVCGSCAGIIESILGSEDELEHIGVDVSEKILSLDIPNNYDPQQIISLLDDVGHEAELIENELPPSSNSTIIYYLMIGLISTLTGGTLMLVHSIPFLPFVFFPALCAGIAIPGIFIGGLWIFKNAYLSIFKQKHLTMDVLFALSLSIIMLSSLASFFVPVLGLPMMCHTGLMIVGFRNLGKFLNEYMTTSVNKATQIQIPFAREYELTNGAKLTKDNLRAGQHLIIRKNQFIPCDGIIINGEAIINEKKITGEMLSANKKSRNQVYSGTLIEDGEITIQISKSYRDSIYAVNQALIREALQSSSTSLQTVSNKIIKIYLPTLLSIATASAIVVGFFNPVNALITFTGILVGACPCVLGIINPLTNKLAFDKAKQNNIAIKDAEALEKFAEIDTFVFDKTGTLADLSFHKLEKVSASYSQTQLQSIAATLEKDSEHPIANVIKQQFSQSEILEHSECVRNVSSRAAIINGKRYHIGGHQLLQTLQLQPPHITEPNMTPVFICTDTECLGYILLQETIRPDSFTFIEFLKARGKQIVLLTGSDENAAQLAASTLKIDSFKANQKPIDKITFIQQLKSQGLKVAMFGDGDNDESALAASDVQVSFENADQLAQSRSSIILPKINPFQKLCKLYLLSQKTTQSIKESILLCLGLGLFSVIMNIACVSFMGLAMNPAVMAGLMFAQVAVVLLNVYKLKWQAIPEPRLYSPQQQTQPCCKLESNFRKITKPVFDLTQINSSSFLSIQKDDRNNPELHAKL